MKRIAPLGPVAATLCAVALLAAVLVGCGSSGGANRGTSVGTTTPAFAASYTHLGPFTVLRSSSRAPGAVLIPGLVVPDGSDVLGTIFPDASGKGGFLALGLVTGDPVAVFNAYVDQAAGLGMTVTSGLGCSNSLAAEGCFLTATDPGDGEQLTIAIDRRPAPPGYVSHIALRYKVPGSVNVATVGAPTVTPPTAPVPVLRLPAAISIPSDEAWNLSVAPNGPGLQLEPGSYLVGPPGPCGCGTKGWSAVLRVTGNADSVLARYAAQLTVNPVTLNRRTADGARATVADLGLGVAGFTQLRLVTQDGATYLLVAVAQL